MTTPLQIALAEAVGYKWYWFVSGEQWGVFLYRLKFALPPEEGVGTCWVGRAGETRAATVGEISSAIQSGDFDDFGPKFDDNFLRSCRTKLLTTPALQEEFLRQLGFLLPPNQAGELGLPTEYDYVNASVENQASALVAMFKTKE